MAIKFYGDYQVYSESGVDLTLLRQNLRRDVDERLACNERAIAMGRAFTVAGRLRRGLPVDCQAVPGTFDAAAFLRRLIAHRIAFVAVGGVAMLAHGAITVTQELALCYSRSEDNIAALAVALEPSRPSLRGAPPGLPFRFDPPTIRRGVNFKLTIDQGDIDLLGEVPGVGTAEEAFAESVEYIILGLTVRVLSFDSFIASRRAAGRQFDRALLLKSDELMQLQDAFPED